MKIKIFAAVLILLETVCLAQTSLKATIRPRFEYRDGVGAPSDEGAIGATFVQQRSRIDFTTKIKGIEIKISPQNVRVWGQMPTLNTSDGLNSIAEGWMSFNLDSTGLWCLKLGRQILSYDDERVLGATDWVQGGRFHDGGKLSYRKDNFKLDAVLVYNQSGVNTLGNIYALSNQVKGIHLLHANKKHKYGNTSLLIMNNLFQDNDLTVNVYAMQTFGLYSIFDKESTNLKGDIAIYGQVGNLANGLKTNSFLTSANVSYKMKKILIGLGGEYISGTDMNATNSKNSSFNPIFGTNHKFNGVMDYYYVGNHINNVGLIDLNLKLVTKPSKKLKLIGVIHQFNSAAQIVNSENLEASSNLGQEFDLIFKYPINNNIKIVGGYSQYFSTTSLSFVKNLINTSSLNNWGWVMLTGSVTKMFKD